MHPEIAQCLRMLARLNYIMGDHVEAMACQQKVSYILTCSDQRERKRED
jgi:protein TIF31